MHANDPYLPPGYSNFHNPDDSSPLDTSAPTSATLSRSYYDDAVMRKKRRVDRACDACRRRKTKCDGPKMAENVCTNCIQSRKKCTYMEESKPRGPSKAYITALEDKVEQLDALLKMLRPEIDLYAELGPPIVRDSWKVNPSAHLPTKLHPDPTNKCRPSPRSTSSSAGHPTSRSTSTHHKQDASGKGKARDPQSDSDDSDDAGIVQSMKLMNLNSEDTLNLVTTSDPLRYGGKSSGFFLLQKAQAAKDNYMEEMKLVEGDNFGQGMGNNQVKRRPEFWRFYPWEFEWDGLHDTNLIYRLTSALPPADLCCKLIDIWFQNVNIHLPLLHRPTFEQQWQSGLQYRDVWFAALCLCIFAVVSRWSDDARVLPGDAYDPTVSGEINLRDAGKKYYDAALLIHQVRRSMVVPACLAEIQTHAAMAIYLRGTPQTSVTWLCISLGLRKAQDLGAHREEKYANPNDIVEELWRRVYWILVILDRLVSSALGRPCCVRGTDCDLKFPREIDDKYWDMSGVHPPIQPSGRPALLVAFNRLISITQNVELVMNSILAVDTSKLRIGIPRGPRWKEEVLMRTNIDMAKWIDSVPQHLRWSPSMSDRVFSDQAATLYTTYYLMQLLIYRPFTGYVPVSDERVIEPVPNFPFPASIICINAAKACARILSVQMRLGFSNVTNMISASYVPGMLLANVVKISAEDKVRQTGQFEATNSQPMSIGDAISVFVETLEFAALRWDSAHTFLQKLKAALPTPCHPPDPVYPHLPAGFDSRTIPREPDNLHQLVPSLPLEFPDPVEIAAPADSISDWFSVPQTPMYVSASYPPRNHHYLDTSNQSTWPERPHNDFVPSIYDNQPPPDRSLTRTYSIDNLHLHSYSTAPVPVPSTSSTRQVTSTWEPQMLTMQTGHRTVRNSEYQGFLPTPTPPVNIPRRMHGQIHNEQSLNWNADEFQYSHPQSFEHNSMFGTGYPQDLPYPTAQ